MIRCEDFEWILVGIDSVMRFDLSVMFDVFFGCLMLGGGDFFVGRSIFLGFL